MSDMCFWFCLIKMNKNVACLDSCIFTPWNCAELCFTFYKLVRPSNSNQGGWGLAKGQLEAKVSKRYLQRSLQCMCEDSQEYRD